MEFDCDVNPAGIAEAHKLIQPHIRLTPVVALDGGDFGLAEMDLTLKLD